MAVQRTDFNTLDIGFQFPVSTYSISEDWHSAYIQAVGDDSELYNRINLIPHISVLTLAMAEMSKNISLPEGAILVSQTLEFYRPVHLNDSITAIATVTEKLKSRRLDLLAIGLRLFNQNNEEIAFAETRFTLNYSQRI